MKKNQKNFCVAGFLFLLFLLWTVAIQYIDVQAIGPRKSSVGFAAFNGFFHNLTGVHMLIYTITDWLGLVPLLMALGWLSEDWFRGSTGLQILLEARC